MAARSAHQPDFLPGSTGPDLNDLSVRQLLVQLAKLEESLRALPPLVVFKGRLIVNPERRPLLVRQRAVVAQLRARRSLLRHGDGTRPAHSTVSATPPPWA